jgi:hypothetical protein
MRLSTFILFNVAMTIIFFCVGYHNLITSTLFDSYLGTMNMSTSTMNSSQPKVIEISNDDPNNYGLVQNIANSILGDPNVTAAFGLAVIAFAVISYLSGFSANFLIPALIIILLMNFFFFPFGVVFDPSLPVILKFFLFAVYNTFTIISAVDFIRGGM